MKKVIGNWKEQLTTITTTLGLHTNSGLAIYIRAKVNAHHYSYSGLYEPQLLLALFIFFLSRREEVGSSFDYLKYDKNVLQTVLQLLQSSHYIRYKLIGRYHQAD